MNRIVDFNAELGLVRLEPGVTQQQLYDYLQKNGHPYYVPTTGAGPAASILGNALERGFGLTPEADHFRAVTSLRAVLADGRVYQSPLEEMGVRLGRYLEMGCGAVFSMVCSLKAAWGIVTQMQIALASVAEHTEFSRLLPKKGRGIEDIAKATQRLLRDMSGVVQTVKNI